MLVRINFAVINSVTLGSLFVFAYTLPVPSSCLICFGLHLLVSDYIINGVPDCGEAMAFSSGGSINAWNVEGGIRDSLSGLRALNCSFQTLRPQIYRTLGPACWAAPLHPIGIGRFLFLGAIILN